MVNLGIDVARNGNIDQEDRAVLAPAHDSFEQLPADDGVRGTRGGDHDVGQFQMLSQGPVVGVGTDLLLAPLGILVLLLEPHRLTAELLREREREAVRAREIIAEEVGSFEEWARSLTVLPTLVAFREWASAIKDEELTKFLGRMPDLSEEDQEKVQALAHSITNKILHPPTVAVKERAAADEGYLYAEALRTLFQLNGADRSQAGASENDRASSGFGSEDETNSNSRS